MTRLCSYPNPAFNKFTLPSDVKNSSLYYRFMRLFCRTYMPMRNQIRVIDRHHEPADGGVLYISNHQCFLDPMLVAFGLQRPMNFMARASLFEPPVLGPFIKTLNCFEVKRGTADVGALKEAIRRLRGNDQVLIFAEGTRTRDGRIGQFLPGVSMLAQRAADWIVPVVIEGGHEVWPRKQFLPIPGKIVVQYDKAISHDEAKEQEPAAFLNGLRDTLIRMQTEIRERLGRPKLIYDDPAE